MGKSTLHMVGLNSSGAIVFREKVSRGRICIEICKPTTLPCWHRSGNGDALCCYVARELVALGHNVKQVPATYAKPFRQRDKNDFRDAHAVADSACLVPNLSEEGVDPERRFDENVGGAQLGSRFRGWPGNRMKTSAQHVPQKNLRDSASRLAASD
jgi:hypothetical protein